MSFFDQGLFANFREVLFPMEAAACFDLVWGMLLENYRIKTWWEGSFQLVKGVFTKEKHSRKRMQSSYCWWFRNPANQLVCSFIPLFTGFYTSWVGNWISSINSTLTLGLQHFGPCKLAPVTIGNQFLQLKSPACKPMSNLQGLQSRRGGCYIPPIKSCKSKNLLLKKIMVPRLLSVFGMVNYTSRAAFFNIICWGAIYPWVQCLR